MVKDWRYSWMVIFILGIIKITHHNSMVNIIGQVEPSIADNFYQECDMDWESGKCYMVIPIKESTWTIRKTAKVFTNGKMDLNILVLSKMTTGMDMEKCNGMMVDHIKVNGSMELKKMSLSN